VSGVFLYLCLEFGGELGEVRETQMFTAQPFFHTEMINGHKNMIEYDLFS